MWIKRCNVLLFLAMPASPWVVLVATPKLRPRGSIILMTVLKIIETSFSNTIWVKLKLYYLVVQTFIA